MEETVEILCLSSEQMLFGCKHKTLNLVYLVTLDFFIDEKNYPLTGQRLFRVTFG